MLRLGWCSNGRGMGEHAGLMGVRVRSKSRVREILRAVLRRVLRAVLRGIFRSALLFRGYRGSVNPVERVVSRCRGPVR